MRIIGSTNLGGWQTKATALDLDLRFSDPDQVDLVKGSLSELELRVPISEIKSDTPGAERSMYRALKARAHPEIIFRLDVERGGAEEIMDNRFNLASVGTLSIAGVARTVDLIVYGRQTKDGKILLQGRKKMLMSDFSIDPPSALFGLVRTRDEIVVVFTLHLQPPTLK